MPYLNRCSFVGNLTRDPELRLPPGPDRQALCLLNLAVNRDGRDREGVKRTRTTFINDIEVWGPPGEACAEHLRTGSLVLVEGRLDLDKWEDKQSGARRSRMKVVADNVQFLRIRREAQGVPAPDGEPAAEPAQRSPGKAMRPAGAPAPTRGRAPARGSEA
ncbi:MAG TPA: single-stranded DNA-binding protein [Opitutaceae bacterium]|jgi:single-strand DNA-binding protein